MRKNLHVRIHNPEEIIWEGTCNAVSSINSVGPFDILPYHANFITLVSPNHPVEVVKSDGERLEFKFGECVLFVRNNFVSVYTF